MKKEVIKNLIILAGLVLAVIPIMLQFQQLLVMYYNGFTMGSFYVPVVYDRFGEQHLEFWFFMVTIPMMIFAISDRVRTFLRDIKKRRSKE